MKGAEEMGRMHRDGAGWLLQVVHAARVIMVAAMVLGGPSAALANTTATATTTVARTRAPAPPVALNASAAGSALRFDKGPKNGLQLTLLRSLLSTARGRAQLRHSYGAATLAALQKAYGANLDAARVAAPAHRAASVGRTRARQRAAGAAASLSVNPSSGMAPTTGALGNTISGAYFHITGTGYTAGETVDVLLDGTVVSSPAAGGGGAIDTNASAPVGTTPGSHTLSAVGRTSGTRATTPLRIYALYATPPEAAPGATTMLTGTGFAPGQVVHFSLGDYYGNGSDPNPLGDGGTDANGAIVPLTVTVPATATRGATSITALEVDGNGNAGGADERATTPFQVVSPTLTLSPAAGNPGTAGAAGSPGAQGDTIHVYGDGFAPAKDYYSGGELVALTIDGKPLNNNNNLTADQYGNLTNPSPYCNDYCPYNTFTIPAGLAPGVHTVEATGQTSGHRVDGTLRVLGLGAVPSRAQIGATTSITGAGFTPGEAVTVTLGAASMPATAGGDTTIGPLNVTVPAGTPPGIVAISATGAAGESTSASIVAYSNTLSLSANAVAAGGTITVTGDDYAPNEQVYLYDGNTQLQGYQNVSGAYTDANGIFTATVTLPTDSITGTHTLQAIGQNSAHTLSAPLRVYAISLAPRSGPAGRAVTVSGGGFAANSPLAVSFNGGAPVNTASDGNGAFGGVRLTVPAGTAAGTYPITATDGAGEAASAPFQVSGATLTLTPTTAGVDQRVTVAAAGFPASTYPQLCVEKADG